MSEVRVINTCKENSEKVLRVAPYCRVSTNSADQLNSYSTQIRVYKEMISKRTDWTLVDIFADEGISGTSAEKRPEFMRMIKACERKEIDLIICKSLSRFARNVKEALEYVRELKHIGVGVIFEKEGINTLSMADEMLLSTFSMMAQEESVATSIRIRNSNTKRMMRGEFIDGNAPYGYRVVNKKLEINESEADVIRQIFESYLRGKSSHDIAKELNESNIPSKKETMWTHTAIRYILRNEKYMGDTLFQKTYHTDVLPYKQKRNRGEEDQYYAENTHEGIVSRKVFEKVNALLDSRKEKLQSEKPFTKYIFTGRMHCTCCGAFFTRKKTNGGLVTWVCSNHLKDKSLCNSNYYREERIESAFIKIINKIRFCGDGILEKTIDNLSIASLIMKKNNSEARGLSEDIAEKNGKLLMIEQLRSKGYIDYSQYLKEVTDITKEITAIKEKRKQFMDTKVDDTLENVKKLKEIIDRLSEPMEEFDDELFKKIIIDIEIDNSDKIKIKLLGGIYFIEQM